MWVVELVTDFIDLFTSILNTLAEFPIIFIPLLLAIWYFFVFKN